MILTTTERKEPMIAGTIDRGRSVRTPLIEEALPSSSTPPRFSPGGAQTMFPLGLLSAGEQAEITSIRDTPDGTGNCRTEEMGLRIGKIVEMLTNGGGAVLLRVDESRVAIDRRVAMKILVRRQR